MFAGKGKNEFSSPVFFSSSYWYSRVVLPRITTIEILVEVVIINEAYFIIIVVVVMGDGTKIE